MHSHTHNHGRGAKPVSISRPGTNPGAGWVRAIESLTPEVPQQSGLSSKGPAAGLGCCSDRSRSCQAPHNTLKKSPGKGPSVRGNRSASPGQASPGDPANSPARAAALPDGSGLIIPDQCSKNVAPVKARRAALEGRPSLSCLFLSACSYSFHSTGIYQAPA